MATFGESSSAPPLSTNEEKPVIVRVKRKASQSRLDAFWLEIKERPLKRPLLDFEKLSVSDSSGKDELKTKKVFVQHVETVSSSKATIDIVQSIAPISTDLVEGERKSKDPRQSVKKRQDQLLLKARHEQETLAKNARFEQIWRSRRGNKEADKAVHEMCHFYDVLRLEVDDKSTKVQDDEEMSVEDQRILCSYLPLLKEFIPTAAAEIESDIIAYMSERVSADDYVYDYYTVRDNMKVDDGTLNPFPLVQVDDEDFYDGPDESEYDSEDSNAEDNPRNDYPDEEFEEEEDEEMDDKSQASDVSADESKNGSSRSAESQDLVCHTMPDDTELSDEDRICDDYSDDPDHFDNEDGGGASDGDDWRWSHR